MLTKTSSFTEIIPTAADWTAIESAIDSTCFHCQSWSNYLRRIGYPPFIVRVNDERNEIIGYFIGSRIGVGRLSFVTAPMLGVGTYTQGLVTISPISEEERVHIYQQLAQWLFKTNKAIYLHVDDWQLRRDFAEWIPDQTFTQSTMDALGVPYTVRPTLYVNLKPTEEELWAGLSYKSCKYCINKARKLGLYVRVITNREDIKGFTRMHYEHIMDVCEHKGMKPKASQERKRMQALCEELFPDRVLMLQVLGNDENGVEQVMSSAIMCIDKGECIYWTGGSYKRYQKYCPNELMVWEGMRILHERGAGDLNFGGMASYKLKFGTKYAYVPRMTFVRYPWMLNSVENLKRYYHKLHVMVGKIATKIFS